jgi:hypothetical protein
METTPERDWQDRESSEALRERALRNENPNGATCQRENARPGIAVAHTPFEADRARKAGCADHGDRGLKKRPDSLNPFGKTPIACHRIT